MRIPWMLHGVFTRIVLLFPFTGGNAPDANTKPGPAVARSGNKYYCVSVVCMTPLNPNRLHSSRGFLVFTSTLISYKV
jgi:hypothetical protein